MESFCLYLEEGLERWGKHAGLQEIEHSGTVCLERKEKRPEKTCADGQNTSFRSHKNEGPCHLPRGKGRNGHKGGALARKGDEGRQGGE